MGLLRLSKFRATFFVLSAVVAAALGAAGASAAAVGRRLRTFLSSTV
jgi:uncharacterized membrane protein YtjA (UPF0391 family)